MVWSNASGHTLSSRFQVDAKDSGALSAANARGAAPSTAFNANQTLQAAAQANQIGASHTAIPTSLGLAAAVSGGTGHIQPLSLNSTSLMGSIAAMKSGPLSHFDSGLASLYQQSQGNAAAGMFNSTHMFDSAMHVDSAGKQWVTVDIVAGNHNGASLLSQLHDLNLMKGGASFGSVASGTIEVSKLGALSQLMAAQNDHAHISAMMTFAGAVTSQADSAEYSDVARADYGVDGSGIRVGVLSDSFDTARNPHDSSHNPDRMADDIASGDLPNDTNILIDDAKRGTDEGRGMAQLVHDIAPGSAIDFATANGGQAAFAQHILDLAANGDQVIVDDVIYYFELAYQQGPIAQAVNQVTAAGVSYFSSAGNDAREGLEQAWTAGGDYHIGRPNGPVMDYTLMQFADGQDYLPINFHGASAVIVLQWDNPGATAGGLGATSDLDLFITNAAGDVVYNFSTADNVGADPVEALAWGGGTYYLRVGLLDGSPAPGEIKIMALGNGAPVDLGTTAGNMNDGTTYGHAVAEGANAVGAARYDATPAFGRMPADSEYFSSSGPTKFLFDDEGNPLAAPIFRGVDITAVDGVNTTFFGFDYDFDGHPNFFGTSAAAPDAAAVAALMLSANAGLNPTDIANLLADSASDMDANNSSPPQDGVTGNTPGFDNGPDSETGAGLIQADLAVGYATTLHISNDDAVVLNGTHFDDIIDGNGNVNLINGGGGNDIITGGIRGDTLAGGGGHDTFVYNSILDSTNFRFDVILDLDNGDRIDLSGIDADVTQNGDQAFTLVNDFDGNAGELQVRYHHSGNFAGATTVRGWVDGDNHVDFLLVIAGSHASFPGFDM